MNYIEVRYSPMHKTGNMSLTSNVKSDRHQETDEPVTQLGTFIITDSK